MDLSSNVISCNLAGLAGVVGLLLPISWLLGAGIEVLEGARVEIRRKDQGGSNQAWKDTGPTKRSGTVVEAVASLQACKHRLTPDFAPTIDRHLAPT